MVSIQVAAVLLAVSGASETVLLDFSADWCGPCRGMEPVVHQLQAAGYPVRKVNVDRERELANRYGVQGIPCFVMIAEGREVDRVVGATSFSQLQGMFAKARPNSPPSASRGQSPDSARDASLAAAPKSPFKAVAVPVTKETAADPLAKNSCPLGPTVTPPQLLAESVRLTIEDPDGISYGSGTLIDARQGEALVLTCGHIFRDSKGKGKITVDMFGPSAPQKIPGQLVVYDLKRDVGLVSLRPGVPVSVARLAPAGYRANKGDKVFSVGCNNGGQPTVQESHVTAIDKFLGPSNVQVSGQPVQGRSGGGLFSADGLVIGVCNAADPADNEGLYAAASTVQAQLDEVKLSDIYRRTGQGIALVASATPPAMPDRMPAENMARTPVSTAPMPTDLRVVAAGAAGKNGDALQKLSPAEKAALAEVGNAAGGAEVICIVRSHTDPRAKSEIIVLDRASPNFLQQLAAERAPQEARHLTSLEVPRGGAAGTASVPAPVSRTLFPWRAH